MKLIYVSLLSFFLSAPMALADVAEKTEYAKMLTKSTIYLMGLSFIVGSLFTVLMLLILDIIKKRSSDSEDS